jgi:hypothetical protein
VKFLGLNVDVREPDRAKLRDAQTVGTAANARNNPGPDSVTRFSPRVRRKDPDVSAGGQQKLFGNRPALD